MATNLQPLTIKRIIVHEVSGHLPHQEKASPIKGYELEALDEEAKIEVEGRIMQVLGRQSQSIEVAVEEDGDDSAFQICAQLLDQEDNDFINSSYALAEKLAEAQAAKSVPGGLVVIFDGEVGQPARRFVAVLKAEKQGGFVRQEGIAGKSLQFLRDIFLTENAKLYKIGFLHERETTDDKGFRNKSNFSVLVYDHLITRGNQEKAAQYFYKVFLGCGFMPDSKHQTRKFYLGTQDFTNKIDLTQEQKLDINQALHVYVNVSSERTIDPVQFAADYIPEQLQGEYKKHISDLGLPSHAIAKDVSALQNELKRRVIVWEDKIRLTAPADVFKNKISIIPAEDDPDTTIITVRSKIKEQK